MTFRMTPAPGTPRIAPHFETYHCIHCRTHNLDPDTAIDQATWTCSDCGQSVQIRVDDQSNFSLYLVERVPARQVQPGDYVLVEAHNYARPYRSTQVLASEPATDQGLPWKVALERDKSRPVDPDRHYYNRV